MRPKIENQETRIKQVPSMCQMIKMLLPIYVYKYIYIQNIYLPPPDYEGIGRAKCVCSVLTYSIKYNNPQTEKNYPQTIIQIKQNLSIEN